MTENPVDQANWRTVKGDLEVREYGDGRVDLRHRSTPEDVLHFTADEWAAFREGALDHEFDV